MALSKEEIAHATDLFSDLGGLSTRRMFGGLGLYRDGTIFAVMRSDGQILLKGAGDIISHLEDLGCTQWTHTRKDGTSGKMPYWTLPDSALDDAEEACDLARQALTRL